jgi:DNA-binding transcriptional LysR family regulator
MFELYQLRYFLAVVETGSFTRAAERVHVTQPTLSAGIAKLEAGLAVRLFDRSNRRVFLTEPGVRFLERARVILAQCSLAESDLHEAQEPDVLRLGVLQTVPAVMAGRLVREFCARHSQVVIELFEGTEQALTNRLDEGRIDVAITVLRGDRSRPATRLFEERYVLAVPAAHRLAEKPRIRVSELAREPIIVRSRCEILSETSRFFTDANVRPRLVYRTEQDERALAMVAAGLGHTTMPESYRAPGVAQLDMEGFDFTRTIVLMREPARPEGQKNDLVDRFHDFAVSHNWGPGA